ncbi:NlpC/P60 family protein [Streptomyces sp. NPDC057743]|uniref:NlpC/P60 family protein n=1 Tax=Streptomyces sp. NPDC057743 TaxID=3346236 RepID=UPI00368BCE64
MPPKKRPLLHTATVLTLLAGSAYLTVELRKDEQDKAPRAQAVTDTPLGGSASGEQRGQTWERLKNPDRTVLRGAGGQVLATFTDRSRTATLKGPSRTFSEAENTATKVVTEDWVRLMPEAWRAGAEKERWFKEWFRRYHGSQEDDLFAIAFQYITGAPAKKDERGVVYAGDAKFGPVNPDLAKHRGTPLLEQSDFFDYLGIPYTFRDGTAKRPEAARYRAVDCSGYMRLVFGYRARYPLAPADGKGDGLPRTANGMGRSQLGAEIIPLSGPAPWYERPQNIDVLQPGDLVFFKMDHHTGNRLDHVGLYLGPDTEGHKVFLSSRKEVNGPTIGDKGGVSRLDGNGFYAQLLRNAKRL